jgi:hypothetical protein
VAGEHTKVATMTKKKNNILVLHTTVSPFLYRKNCEQTGV